MYCPNCGANIPDGSKFCPQCGGKIENDEGPDKQTGNSQSDNSGNLHGSEDGSAKKRLSNRTIGIIIAAAVVVVVIIVLIIALSGGGNTINLDNYVEISVTGSEGYGKATAEINKDALIEDYSGKLKWKDNSDWENSALKLLYSDPVDALVASLSGSLDETSGLSNGDTIHFIWNIDADDIEAQINVKLKYSDFDYKVSGLGDMNTYDAFADVSVEFAGTSPEADALLTVKDNYLSESAYSLDKSDNLAIGDTVTVTISEDAAEKLVEEKGIYPAEMSHTYTVEDVSYYAESVDEIPDDAMDRLKSESEDAFHSHVANDWEPEVIELKSMDFLGTYFLYRKDGIEEGNANKIYLIYKIQSTLYDENKDGTFTGHDLEYYTYVGFFDGIVMTDGTFSINYTEYECPWDQSDSVSFTVTYNEYLPVNDRYRELNLKVAGTLNLDDMFTYLVTRQVDNYTYEDTVVDSQPENEEQPETEEQPVEENQETEEQQDT